MADKSNDPVAMWQNMMGEMEKGFNSFANQAMTSPEFSKVMNQVGSVGAGAQKQLGELMEKYLVSMNLPSRAQMVRMDVINMLSKDLEADRYLDGPRIHEFLQEMYREVFSRRDALLNVGETPS